MNRFYTEEDIFIYEAGGSSEAELAFTCFKCGEDKKTDYEKGDPKIEHLENVREKFLLHTRLINTNMELKLSKKQIR